MEKLFAFIFTVLFNLLIVSEVSCQYGGGCDEPGAIQLSIKQMCELVPDTGTGTQDIVRIYYNPVLQQCLPFSWSGVGGNANRFISIKNCYEICHPADPGFRRLTASGVRAYLVKRKPPKYCNGVKPGIPELGVPETIIPESKAAAEKEEEKPQISGDVVVRQIRNPFDSTKLLTIVQPITYIIPKGKRNIVVDKRPYRQPYGQAFGQTRGRPQMAPYYYS